MIRPLTRNDREAVLRLLAGTGMFTEAEIAVAEEQLDIFLTQPAQKDYDIVVVADEAGGVAGFLSWGPTPLTEGTYDLYWMAVAPNRQGRGYGKALVRWLEDRARAANGRLIVIETSSQPKYHPTRAFYLGLGYNEAARIPDFYKPGDARVIYTKELVQE
ncbi:MAG: GNAT family N-acetyltransferase [Candidatus Aminicenantes bacterium]|nr:GNAT family N-acetyltransferase [Candidatus Aminicenantes bacterium]